MLQNSTELAAELIQIYYEDSQLSELYPFARPYRNDKLTIFFENEVIARLVPTVEAERIAICSWRLREKMYWQLKKPRDLTEFLLDHEPYDVLSFTNNSQSHRMLAAAEGWHPGFIDTLRLLLDKINVSQDQLGDSTGKLVEA